MSGIYSVYYEKSDVSQDSTKRPTVVITAEEAKTASPTKSQSQYDSSSDTVTPSTPSPAYVAEWSKSPTSYDLNGSTACTTPNTALNRHDSFGELLPALQRITAFKATKIASDGTTFAYKYPDLVYNVVEVAKKDDGDRLPAWKRRVNSLMPFTTALTMLTYVAYLSVRLIFTIEASYKWPGPTFSMAWLFVAVEICIMAPCLIHQFFQVVAWRGRIRPKLRLMGSTYAPTVDVIITCCKEEPDVVLDTARAACNVDYPSDRFRVIITDDGADEHIKAGVKALALTYPNIHYFARVKVKGQPHHFKAGNLKAATAFTDNLEGGSAEYIACLDADMIPVRHWLRTVIAAMIKDPLLGLICPPQLFYNVPLDDPLTQRLDGWCHVMEPVKDSVGVAWCTGSGYAIRRRALDSVGGWPLGTLAEDTMTSSLLLGQGWRTAYVHEALQWGTVPEDYATHLKQRTRWTLGTLQMAKALNFGLYGDIVRKMTLFQRLSGLVITFDAMWKPLNVIALQTLPIVLISGKKMVAYTSDTQLIISISLNCAGILLNILNDWIVGLPAGYRQTQRDIHCAMWMSPYHAYTVLRSFLLPTWLGGKAMAFQPTGSLQLAVCERDKLRRAPLWRRVKFMLWDCGAWVHLAYILFCLAAIGTSIWRSVEQTNGTPKEITLYMITHLLWPPLLLLRIIISFMTPLLYAIFPPTMPSDREEYFTRNPKTGVAVPKEEYCRQRWSRWNLMYEVLTLVMGAWSVGAVVLVSCWIL